MNSSRNLILFFLLICLLISFLLSLLFGGSGIAAGSVFKAIFSPDMSSPSSVIVWELRLPRTFLALLVGAGLSVSGCLFQGLLRNPLADPYTLGISGGAALGVTLASIIGIEAVLGHAGAPLAAVAGALLSLTLTYGIAGRNKFAIPTLILGGVVLSFVFSALIILTLSLLSAEKVQGTIIWLMGDLSGAQKETVTFAFFPVTLGITISVLLGQRLNVITLGEEKAGYLGLSAEVQHRIFFLTASLLTGTCVAASGVVSFVGLIVPHFFRKLVGPNHLDLIPVSALGGAIFLIICDTLARTVIAPLEIPVGVITGIIGGISLLYLLIKSSENVL